MTAAGHVGRFATVVGEHFELVRELPGGRALEITSGNGERFVLKWDDHEDSKRRRREAIAAAEHLGSAAGWPVPTFDLVENDEWLYVRQGLMPGAEPERLTEPLWRQVIELVDATAGLGAAPGLVNDWPLRLVDTLVAEPSDPSLYCSHEPLEGHGDLGRRLIGRIESIGAAAATADLGPADDVMHWDLHPGNVLLVDDTISAVIDLDNAGPGQRDFDLITFALSAQILRSDAGVSARIEQMTKDRVSEELWVASIAHLVLRFSNWAMRTGRTAEANHWVAEGTRLLGP